MKCFQFGSQSELSCRNCDAIHQELDKAVAYTDITSPNTSNVYYGSNIRCISLSAYNKNIKLFVKCNFSANFKKVLQD